MAPEDKPTATGQNAPGNGHDGVGNVARAGLHVLRRHVPGRDAGRQEDEPTSEIEWLDRELDHGVSTAAMTAYVSVVGRPRSAGIQPSRSPRAGATYRAPGS